MKNANIALIIRNGLSVTVTVMEYYNNKMYFSQINVVLITSCLTTPNGHVYFSTCIFITNFYFPQDIHVRVQLHMK